MFNKSQPLWLPRGSVRAILAIALVAAVIVGTGGDVIETLATAVVAFYFGAKVGAETPGPTPADTDAGGNG